jgi:CheY-like chemotaxis protein
MEAIGTLAGGIAHDFNNLLTGIQGHASLMTVDQSIPPEQQEHIKAIETYVKSAKDLTAQLLGLARGGKYEIKPIDINVLLHTSATMFGRTHKEIRIHDQRQPTPLVVEADRRQIEQVLLNLFINAMHAMPGGGEIYLKTSLFHVDNAFCKIHTIKTGSYVKISITDTGIGMDKTTQQRIFDPFFTTKDKGRGTGLGLASAFGIIKNHGGTITVYSELGHGASFNLYLPLSDKAPVQEPTTDTRIQQGSETILLVDDEEMIRKVAGAMLKKLGYQVVVAASGAEAVETITRRGDSINLVILDMIMPDMDGGTTFDRLRAITPKIPVLLSSGYSINGQAIDIMQKGCKGFIQKPFTLSELSQKIRQIFEDAKGEAE